MSGCGPWGLAVFAVFATSVAVARAETNQSETTQPETDLTEQNRPEQNLAGEVLRIFQAHCVECHGPKLKKPRGRFGHVTDLARMAADPDLIVPFKPEKSELYLMVYEGEMPPPDEGVPAPTPGDTLKIRRWIEAGAKPAGARPPIETPDAAETPAAPAPAEAAATESKRGSGRSWTVMLGRLHPASVHLPIGVLVAACLAELLYMVRRRPGLRSAALFCVAVAALSAVPVAVLGWWNAEAPTYAVRSSALLAWHRWIGVTAATFTVAAWLASIWCTVRSTSTRATGVYRILLFIAVVIVGLTGFLGGLNVYGPEHYGL